MREADRQIIQLLTELRDDVRSLTHDKEFVAQIINKEQHELLLHQMKWTNRWLLYFAVCTICLSIALAGMVLVAFLQ